MRHGFTPPWAYQPPHEEWFGPGDEFDGPSREERIAMLEHVQRRLARHLERVSEELERLRRAEPGERR
jgi:hypothetical protein